MAGRGKKKTAKRTAKKTADVIGDEAIGGGITMEDLEALVADLAISPDIIQSFEDRASKFEQDGAELWEYTQRRLLVHLQILDYAATHPAPTKTGLQLALAAAREFRTVADLATENAEILERRRQEQEKKTLRKEKENKS